MFKFRTVRKVTLAHAPQSRSHRATRPTNTLLQCLECNHAPFDTKAKLNKHSSSKHRRAETFEFGGVAYPLTEQCVSEQEPIPDPSEDIRSSERITDDTEALVTCGNISEIRSMEDLGFMIEAIWKVAICSRCMVVDAILHVACQYALRPHLAILWDETTENQGSGFRRRGPRFIAFNPTAFRPGSLALRGIPGQDGFKCEVCEQRLRHICRHHPFHIRHVRPFLTHPNQTVEYHQVRVQAFYGRSNVQSQLRFVEVTENQSTDLAPLSAFGIPENIHSVPGHESAVVDRKDLNQFGVKFQGYTLEMLTLRMLEASREDTMAGFQPLLGKVMVGDSDKY
ncbi:hypothetical protein V1508DRAFT_406605 [Lipomyces doorenjongii]|uniref:uncharacterized protein n=1 Tax=Lipomyces doorenjongii TaxID=383834 RepID=UPI0034D0029B